MKKIWILCVLLLGGTFGAIGQIDKTGEKSEERNTHQDHMLVDFGYETFTSNPSNADFRWYNNGLNIQLFYDQLFGQSGISLAVGVGFSTQSYYSNRQIRRDTTKQEFYPNWMRLENEPYNKNKVSTSFVDIPLELRYRTKMDDNGYRWKFSVGAKIGFLFDTHDKYVDLDGIKYKTYYFPDMNRTRIAMIARIGYGKVNFYGSFGLTEFFIPGRGPEMKQLGFGISLVPF